MRDAPRQPDPTLRRHPAATGARARRATVRGDRGRSRRPRGRRSGVAGGRALKIAAGVVIALALVLLINWIAQVVRKPAELLFPVSGRTKTPAQTWRSYAPLFREYSTAVISPSFLAALAQAEGAGDPVARTYWRWAWEPRPVDWYRPASSSVGLYQMTDGLFAEARQLCVIDHRVAVAGPDGCRFNALYSRVVPAHAIELTAAYLDRAVRQTLAGNGIGHATVQERQHLAAAIHLCGAGAGHAYARGGFRFPAGQRCGAHDPRGYLARVDGLQREFEAIAAAGGGG